MEKNNTLLLTVIAISTLLVAVVGATFAYFTASSNPVTNITNLVASSEGGVSEFTAVFDHSDISFDIGLTEMQEGDSNEDEGKTASVNLNVSLKSANDNTVTVCPYDVYFTWTGDGNNYGTLENPLMYFYKKSDDVPLEFDYQFYGLNGGASQDRRHFPTTLVTSTQPIKLFSDSITSSDSMAESHHDYRIRTSFYNNPSKNQDEQKGKTFSGEFSVVVGECTYSSNQS